MQHMQHNNRKNLTKKHRISAVCSHFLIYQLSKTRAIYTMVKNNTFNGMRLPDIVLEREDGECEIVHTFGYEDFKTRI